MAAVAASSWLVVAVVAKKPPAGNEKCLHHPKCGCGLPLHHFSHHSRSSPPQRAPCIVVSSPTVTVGNLRQERSSNKMLDDCLNRSRGAPPASRCQHRRSHGAPARPQFCILTIVGDWGNQYASLSRTH